MAQSRSCFINIIYYQAKIKCIFCCFVLNIDNMQWRSNFAKFYLRYIVIPSLLDSLPSYFNTCISKVVEVTNPACRLALSRFNHKSYTRCIRSFSRSSCDHRKANTFFYCGLPSPACQMTL